MRIYSGADVVVCRAELVPAFQLCIAGTVHSIPTTSPRVREYQAIDMQESYEEAKEAKWTDGRWRGAEWRERDPVHDDTVAKHSSFSFSSALLACIGLRRSLHPSLLPCMVLCRGIGVYRYASKYQYRPSLLDLH